MQEFINIGEKLLSALERLGDWLLYQPFSIAETLGFQQSPNYSAFSNWVLGLLEQNRWLVHLSVGGMLLGSMLTFVLGYKVIKFFTSIL